MAAALPRIRAHSEAWTVEGIMAEVRLTDVFVEMADTLIDDFDVIELMHLLTERCVQLLGVAAAGLMLIDERGALQVVAASSERTRVLELFQLQTEQGPCLDCFRTGRAVSIADLTRTDRWPWFSQAAAEAGFVAVHAMPMRLRAEVIGALNLFNTAPGIMDEEGRRVGQALADVATIGLLQQRTIRRRDALTEQLQTALNSRILIEQAKGVLAERLGIAIGEAFDLLRRGARSRKVLLSDFARAVVGGSVRLSRDDIRRNGL